MDIIIMLTVVWVWRPLEAYQWKTCCVFHLEQELLWGVQGLQMLLPNIQELLRQLCPQHQRMTVDVWNAARDHQHHWSDQSSRTGNTSIRSSDHIRGKLFKPQHQRFSPSMVSTSHTDVIKPQAVFWSPMLIWTWTVIVITSSLRVLNVI